MQGKGAWTAWILVVATALLSAGCIGMADEPALEETSSDAPPADEPDGNMTVDRSEETMEGTRANAPPFYASRVITVQGELTLPTLPIDLSTVNGPIEVTTGAEDRYRLVANLSGYGYTPQTAEENRDELSLGLDTGQPGDRRLSAHVEHDEDDEDTGPIHVGDDGSSEGKLTLELPPALVTALSAQTTNGAVDVSSLTASTLGLGSTNGAITVTSVEASTATVQTTNGAIDVEVSGTRTVSLGSTNGAVSGTVRPAQDGALEADTTNAKIDLTVPEDAAHGYLAQASTTNGDVDIQLEDGSTQSSGGYAGEDVTFQTNGFDDRRIQTTVSLSSTNGDIVLGPT